MFAILCSAITQIVEATMYQFDTSLAVYTLKQAEAVLNQSNAMFAKMIDDSLEFNRAMLNLEFVDLTPTDALATLFPSATASGAKKKISKAAACTASQSDCTGAGSSGRSENDFGCRPRRGEKAARCRHRVLRSNRSVN